MSEYRGYAIKFKGMMVEIAMKGSGALPESLKGFFTSKREAMLAIDTYANTKGKKRATNKPSS